MIRHLSTIAAFGMSMLAVTPAPASIVMVDSSSIQGQEVLFNNPGPYVGTTVTGHTNQSNTLVDFRGTTVSSGNIPAGNVIMAGGGQAVLTGILNTETNPPNDTVPLNSLSLSLQNGQAFNNLEFNLFGPAGRDVTATFTVFYGNTSITFNNNGAGFAIGNGENKFGFVGTLGDTITSFSAAFSGAGLDDMKQVRLDPVASAVPEPATWAMLIVGFAGIGLMAYRRKMPTPLRVI